MSDLTLYLDNALGFLLNESDLEEKPLIFLIDKTKGPSDFINQLKIDLGRQEFSHVKVVSSMLIKGGKTVATKGLNEKWNGFPLKKELKALFKGRVEIISEADFRVRKHIRGKGIEIVISLDHTIKSYLFMDGLLLPGFFLEESHYFANMSYEQVINMEGRAALGHPCWEDYLEKALGLWKKLFPLARIIIIGSEVRFIKSKTIKKKAKVINDDEWLS